MSDRYVEPEFRMGWWMPAEWPRHRVWSDMLYCPFCGAGVREGRKGKHMLKAHREIHQKIVDRCNKLNLEVLNSKGVAWIARELPEQPATHPALVNRNPTLLLIMSCSFVNNLLSLPWYSHVWPPGRYRYKQFNCIQFQVDSGRHDYMKVYSCCSKICAGQNSTFLFSALQLKNIILLMLGW